MSNDPYILITSDTHAGANHATYREYLDPEYREQFDEWRGAYKNPAPDHYGVKKLRNWDLETRINDQNSQLRQRPRTAYTVYSSSFLTHRTPGTGPVSQRGSAGL